MAQFTNPLATVEQLQLAISLAPLPFDLQEIVFVTTQCLTQAAGRLLRLSQSVTAQANVILARHWLVDSPMALEFSDASAAAIYIAAKLGPLPRSPRDVANVYTYLVSQASAFFQPIGEPPPDHTEYRYLADADYFAFSHRLLAAEARVLTSLSFDTNVSLPHPLAITYLQTLDFLSKPKTEAAMRTIQYLNTALLSPQMLYLTHQPHALATAAIYIAARDLGAKMPECAWWEVFDVDREELGFLVVAMRSLQGFWRKRKEEMDRIGKGMMTRKSIEEEMQRRGLSANNGHKDTDEEDALMKLMDTR